GEDPSARGSPLSARLQSVLGLAAVALGLVAVRLILEQGDGYIPLLGAAKDLELVERPLRRDLVASVESLGHATFPLTPLVVLGSLSSGRSGWGARWLAVGLAVHLLWSSVYGDAPLLLGIPAALAAAAGLELLVDPKRDPILRRVAIVIVVAGVWVLTRDAEQNPSVVAYPMYAFTR